MAEQKKAKYRIEMCKSDKETDQPWFHRIICIANGECMDRSEMVANKVDMEQSAENMAVDAGWPVVKCYED